MICLTHRQTRSSLYYSLGYESHRMYKGRLFLLKIGRKASKPGNKFTGPKNKEFWRKCLSLSHCLPLRRAWGVYLTCFNYIDWRDPKVDVEQPLWLDRFRFSTDETSLSFPSPIHACIRRQGICSQTINHLIRENVFSFTEKYCLLHLYVSLVSCYRI